MKRRTKEAWAAYAFLSPWMIGFLIFMAVPMVASLVLSFTDYDALRSPDAVGWTNYRRLFDDPAVRKSLVNTLVYTVLSVPSTMAVSLALASLLSRAGRRWAGFFRTVFYLPEITPKVAVGVLFLILFNGQAGLVNAVLGLVGIDGPQWSTDPLWVKPGLVLMHLWSVGSTVVIYLAALQGVPRELYEAAELDGASAWQRFRRITVPMISGALFFTLIVQTIAALQSFDEAYTAFYGSAASATYSSDAALFYLIYLFQQAFEFLHLGYASAMAWLLFLVILAITLVQVRLSRRFVHYEGGDR
ncbi:carbohydrate ABC transporter permease [Amycolatopsis australiensis]|uniref:Carbohydrate ABC transporter membrane protein 1, CUT1 family n=1 Tax=Amycolatopsis australiensis TaxID=546364 RepID=A0A1K1SP13_9PSEU|nr:sugar ABC transporter permease [Amycolatopsis australiensis]SFW86034.1 carbohydrate ABC transporter membrane protein 1, CUT1 family [Amycolatopsis australiensis]